MAINLPDIFFSITLIYILEINNHINKSKAKVYTGKRNKKWTILDPTLKQVIIRVHSNATQKYI